jgi:hypothetical protein
MFLCEKYRLTHLMDKGRSYCIERWPDFLITSKDMDQAIGLLCLMPWVEKEDDEWIRLLSDLIKAKFGSFAYAKPGEFG